jgi:hypothetical protein
VSPGSRVCAEAPPDAVDAYANAIAGKADANVSYPNSITAGGSVSLGQSFAVSSGLGLYRSQGLQVLRDQSFGLCVLLAQGIITGSQWATEHAAVLKAAKELIEKEEPAILEAAKRPALVVSAPDVNAPLPAANPPAPKQQNNPTAPKQQTPAANNPPAPPNAADAPVAGGADNKSPLKQKTPTAEAPPTQATPPNPPVAVGSPLGQRISDIGVVTRTRHGTDK